MPFEFLNLSKSLGYMLGNRAQKHTGKTRRFKLHTCRSLIIILPPHGCIILQTTDTVSTMLTLLFLVCLKNQSKMTHQDKLLNLTMYLVESHLLHLLYLLGTNSKSVFPQLYYFWWQPKSVVECDCCMTEFCFTLVAGVWYALRITTFSHSINIDNQIFFKQFRNQKH